MDEYQKNVFIIFWSNITQFFSGFTRLFRGKEAGWDNLPPELCGEIGKRLKSRLDMVCFRSVCKQWRSALPTQTRFPLLVPPPPSCEPEFRNLPYLITEASLYCFKRSVRYVAFEEVDQVGRFVIHHVHPRSGNKLSESEHPHSKMSFLSKGYLLRMSYFPMNPSVKKVVLISSNEDSVDPSYAWASSLTVVAHLSSGFLHGRLALLRLGRSPENLDWDTNFCTRSFEAICSYKGHLCALDHLGRVFLMDYNSLQMSQIAPALSIVRGIEEKQLFEASGDLYLAHYKKNGVIEGYKLSERYKKWVKPKRGINDKVSALVPYQLYDCRLIT